MITRVTCEYIDDKTNEKTLTHDLSKITKAKFRSVSHYFAFVDRYTGIPEPRNRDTVKTTIIHAIERYVASFSH